jgi:hypothetical protein
MSKNKLEVAKNMQQEKLDKLAESEVGKVLDIFKTIPNKTMPLDVYKSVFEPIFTAEQELDESMLDLVNRYIGYAGSIKASVDIVDENKNVVGTIPGLYHTMTPELVDSNSLDSARASSYLSTLDATGSPVAANKKQAIVDSIATTVKENIADVDFKIDKLTAILEGDDSDDEVSRLDDDIVIYDD